MDETQRAYDRWQPQQRDFEGSVALYRSHLEQHLAFYDREITLLCGSPDPAACEEIRPTTLRLEAVLQEVRNLIERINNTIEAEPELSSLRDEFALMEIANGEHRAHLVDEMAMLQAEADQAQQTMSYNGAADEELDTLIERLRALQLGEFVRPEDRMRSIFVQRFIIESILEVIARRIELKLVLLSRRSATGMAPYRRRHLPRILAERQVWRNLSQAGDAAFRDPTLRVIRDLFLKQYMNDFEEALRRVYLTAGALAYEINLCPGNRCPALLRDPDALLSNADLGQLRDRLREMSNVLLDFESRYRMERMSMVLSLSQILGFRTRVIGGEVISARQQFYTCLQTQVEGREVPPYCPPFDVSDPDPETNFYRTVNFRFPVELAADPEDRTPLVPAQLANLRLRSIKARIEGPPAIQSRFAGLPLTYGPGVMSQRGPDAAPFAERDVIRHYNTDGAGTATLQAAIGFSPFDSITAFSDKFIYRTLGFSDYQLVLSVNPQLYPENPALIGPLSNVNDIAFEFTCDTFTLSAQ